MKSSAAAETSVLETPDGIPIAYEMAFAERAPSAQKRSNALSTDAGTADPRRLLWNSAYAFRAASQVARLSRLLAGRRLRLLKTKFSASLWNFPIQSVSS